MAQNQLMSPVHSPRPEEVPRHVSVHTSGIQSIGAAWRSCLTTDCPDDVETVWNVASNLAPNPAPNPTQNLTQGVAQNLAPNVAYNVA